LRNLAIVLIVALSGALLSSASAMTVTKPVGAMHAAVEHVDYKKNKFRHKRQNYRAGGHYNRAPSNWHRYDRRPGDWQRRGCVIVGPIWWCP
jgi:hypothetical protein